MLREKDGSRWFSRTSGQQGDVGDDIAGGVGRASNAVCARGDYLREDELAERWRVSRRTLQRWRSEGKAPPHLQIGQRILYREVDLAAFEARHLQSGRTA